MLNCYIFIVVTIKHCHINIYEICHFSFTGHFLHKSLSDKGFGLTCHILLEYPVHLQYIELQVILVGCWPLKWIFSTAALKSALATWK